MEVLSHDMVENIFERVPVKSQARFKSLSKQWKSRIESKNFQERQLIHRQQSRAPDVLLVYRDGIIENIPSSTSSIVPIILPLKTMFHCTTSCDGLVCLYDKNEIFVANPTTRWYRTLPPSNFQEDKSGWKPYPPPLGFGKDKFNGTYKAVWLCKKWRRFSLEENKENVITTCEVFDFSTNAWRYVTHPSPCEFIDLIDPAYVDGSLHWLTKDESETQVLSFDLHTETFQVITTPPFPKAHYYHICNLNNSLCVSQTNWPNQVLWLFDSGSKTWNHMHSIDLEMACSWFRKSIHTLKPLAVLEEKNMKTGSRVMFKLIIYGESDVHIVIYDYQAKSYDLAFTFDSFGVPLCYFQSLISI